MEAFQLTQKEGECYGIDYNNKSYGYLLMMASILKDKAGSRFVFIQC